MALSTTFFMCWRELYVRDIDDKWWFLSLRYVWRSIHVLLPLRRQSLSKCSMFTRVPCPILLRVVVLFLLHRLSYHSVVSQREFCILHRAFFRWSSLNRHRHTDWRRQWSRRRFKRKMFKRSHYYYCLVMSLSIYCVFVWAFVSFSCAAAKRFISFVYWSSSTKTSLPQRQTELYVYT